MNNAEHEPTPYQFTEDNLNENPREFWEQIHKLTINKLSSVFMQQINVFMQNVMNTFIAISAEVTIFRELEARIRNKSLTDEILNDIMNRIASLRSEIQAKAASEVEARAQLQAALKEQQHPQ